MVVGGPSTFRAAGPILGLPTGLLTLTFTAGDSPGQSVTSISMNNGTSVQMHVRSLSDVTVCRLRRARGPLMSWAALLRSRLWGSWWTVEINQGVKNRRRSRPSYRQSHSNRPCFRSGLLGRVVGSCPQPFQHLAASPRGSETGHDVAG